MDLSSKVVLLTGARRVGAVVAATLARRGADIAVAFNRSRGEAEQVATDARAAGRRAVVIQGDVSLEAGCRAIVEAVTRQFGRLDVLINMASLYQSMPFDELDAAAWDRQLGVD